MEIICRRAKALARPKHKGCPQTPLFFCVVLHEKGRFAKEAAKPVPYFSRYSFVPLRELDIEKLELLQGRGYRL